MRFLTQQQQQKNKTLRKLPIKIKPSYTWPKEQSYKSKQKEHSQKHIQNEDDSSQLLYSQEIMNVLLPPIHQQTFHPHQYENPHYSHTRNTNMMSNSRKRKVEDDPDDHMAISPSPSPAISTRPLSRPSKKLRSNEVTGRPLTLPRLLETLDADSLRAVLHQICEQRPEIGREVVAAAPRPSVESALSVLGQYQEKLRESFPYGDDSGSEYSYNRVKQALSTLIDALVDFTPHYLPPNETQISTSCSFLDGATKFVHELPNWQNEGHRYHKDNAYDEISRAWQLVIVEAGKRGAGIQISYGGWDQKLRLHNEVSGGRLGVAVAALGSQTMWMKGSAVGGGNVEFGGEQAGQRERIRNELLNGTYGNGIPLRVGPW